MHSDKLHLIPDPCADEQLAVAPETVPFAEVILRSLEFRLADIASAVVSLAPPPRDPSTISSAELILLGLENRMGRLANAAETANVLAVKGADNVEKLTAVIHRLADALDGISETLAVVTERVTSDADGVTRGYVRTRNDRHGHSLGMRDDRDDED